MRKNILVRSIVATLVLIYALRLCVHAAVVMDYRMDILQINPNNNYKVDKPIANFVATIKTPAGAERETKSPYTGMGLAYDANGNILNTSLIYKATAYVGDSIEIRDNSTLGSGNQIIGCDFQWYSNQTSGQIYVTKEELNNTKFTFTQPGTWRLYYNVKDNAVTNIMPNWSENGCHVTIDYKNFPEGIKWYYVRLDVEVLPSSTPGSVTTIYRGWSNDGSLSELRARKISNHTINGDQVISVTESAPTITGYDFVSSAIGNSESSLIDILNGVISRTVEINSQYPNKYVVFTYQQKPAAGIPTIGITANPQSVTPGQAYNVTDLSRPSEGAATITKWRVKEEFTPKNGGASQTILSEREITSPESFFKSYSKTAEGTYTYTLTSVTDNLNRSRTGTASVSVTVTKTPSDSDNKPPVAIIDAPDEVRIGEEFVFSGAGSYDEDGEIVEYTFSDESASIAEFGTDYKIIWYDTIGTRTLRLAVKDNSGARANTTKKVSVIGPYVYASFIHTGTLKENRKVTLINSSDTPDRYPLINSDTKWTIEPVSSGLTTSDIKYVGSLTGVDQKDVLFKKAGQYKVTISVRNTAGYTDTYSRVITIEPDQAPVANFTVAASILRNPSSSNQAQITLQDASYSPDGDFISQRIWSYAYDSDNDGNFTDEEWKIIDNVNLTTPSINVSDVGRYKFELDVVETFGQSTITEFVLADDYRSNNTLSKPDQAKICEVQNVRPSAEFDTYLLKKVDIQLLVDQEYVQGLQDNLVSIKRRLLENHIDASITIQTIDDTLKSDIEYQRSSPMQRQNSSYAGTFLNNKLVHMNNGYLNVEDPKGSYISSAPNGTNINFYNAKNFTNDAGTEIYSARYSSRTLTFYRTNIKTMTVEIIGSVALEDESVSKEVLQLYTTFKDNKISSAFSISSKTSRNVSKYRIVEFDVATRNVVDRSESKKSSGTFVAMTNNSTYYLDGSYLIAYAPNSSRQLLKLDLGYKFSVTPLWETYAESCIYLYLVKDNIRRIQGFDTTDVLQDLGYVYENTLNRGISEEYTKYSNKNLMISKNSGHVNQNYLLYILDYKNLNDVTDKSIDLSSLNFYYTIPLNFEYIDDYLVLRLKYQENISDTSYRYGYFYFKNGNFIGQQTTSEAVSISNIKWGYVTSPDQSASNKIQILNLLKPRVRMLYEKLMEHTTENGVPSYRIAMINKSLYPEGADDVARVVNSNGLNMLLLSGSDSKVQSFKNNLVTQSTINSVALSSNLDENINNIINYIINKAPTEKVSKYVLLNEELAYTTYYSDYESDPQYASRWKFTHTDPSYFDNSLGALSNQGVYLTNPILKFDKVGKITAAHQVQDNPKNSNLFNNYRLWSDEKQVEFFVHRRPIADFSLSVKPGGPGYYLPVLSDTSYDLDHTSRADKGIVAWQWSWKDAEASAWTNGQPISFTNGKSYMVQLQVQDLEGAWSTPTIRPLDTDSVNFPPTVDANPQAANTDKNITVTVTADDLGENDFSRTNYFWSRYTNKPSSGWTTTTAKVFQTVLSNEGTWYLHMEAYDNSGQSFYRYRGPYTLTKNRAPTVSISIDQSLIYENDDVTINMLPVDPDGDEMQLVLQSSKNGGAWTTIFTKGGCGSSQVQKHTMQNIANGSYRLRVVATDPGGLSANAETSFTTLVLDVTGAVYPNPALAGEKVYFSCNTTGYAETCVIYLWNGDTVSLTPEHSVTTLDNRWTGEYIVPLKTPDSTYNFIAMATKDARTDTAPLQLTIKGNIYDLVKPRIRDSN